MLVYQKGARPQSAGIDAVIEKFVAGKTDRAWFWDELTAFRVWKRLKLKGIATSIRHAHLLDRTTNELFSIWWVVVTNGTPDPTDPADMQIALFFRLLELAEVRGIRLSMAMPAKPISDRLFGFYCRHPETGEPAIWINPSPSIPFSEKLFTLAHELAHFALQHEANMFSRDPSGIARLQQAEADANRFARRLLRFMERVHGRVKVD